MKHRIVWRGDFVDVSHDLPLLRLGPEQHLAASGQRQRLSILKSHLDRHERLGHPANLVRSPTGTRRQPTFRHLTVADLREHGTGPGAAAETSIERFGTDAANIIQALALPPALLVGNSMGYRGVVEAALQAPHVAGTMLVDGSQFVAAMETVLKQTFAAQNDYRRRSRRHSDPGCN